MKKKGKKQVQAFEEKRKEQNSNPTLQEEKKPFDFGGLPQRDLKKNLGCG